MKKFMKGCAITALLFILLGLILGVNPVAGAVVMCIVAALGIEAIRKKILHACFARGDPVSGYPGKNLRRRGG